MELGVLMGNFRELNVFIERLETRMRYHETRAQNITMAYLFWVRLFFFAISQTSSSLKCTDWWVVLALSLSCTFLYFVFFMMAVTMLYRTQYQLDIICKEQADIWQQLLEARNQDDVVSLEAGDSSDGLGFSFSFHMKIFNYDSWRIVEKKVYICSIVCALLAVTAFELYACKYLLCN